MVRGYYIAGTGMITERARLNVISNNIANVDTVGYKKDSMLSRSFNDLLLQRTNDPALGVTYPDVGPINTGVYADETVTSFNQGMVESTGLKTDMMINGDAFFVVKGTGDELYTRAGNFTLDGEGNLLDAYGNFVQSESGNIKLTNEQFTVYPDGTIIDDVSGAEAGKIKMVAFEDNNKLLKVGTNMFSANGAQDKTPDETVTVTQGAIETSNADVATEMVNMIIANRAYGSNAQTLQLIDGTVEKAVNNIAAF